MTYRTSVIFRRLPLILLFAFAGCPRPAPTTQTVILYEFGGHSFTVQTQLPHLCTNPDDQRRAAGYQLYAEKNYREAEECFRMLFDTEHELDAKLMCGIIKARQGKYGASLELINECFIDPNSGMRWRHSSWPYKQNNTWPGMAKVWVLCEAGELDAAESTAVRTTELNTNEVAWSVLREVRRRQDTRSFLSTIFLIVSVVLVSVVSFQIVWSVWLERVFRTNKLRRELKSQLSGKLISAEGIKAQLVTELAKQKVGLILNERALEQHIGSCKSAFEVIDVLIKVYDHASDKIDGLELPNAKKELKRKELEKDLKKMLEKLVSTT